MKNLLKQEKKLILYYFYLNSDEDENEFSTAKMENENLLNARNEYRKMHG